MRLSLARKAGSLVGLFLVATSGAPDSSAAGPAPLPLEVAQGELGKVRSGGDLLLAADEKGREIFLFDESTKKLSTFLESGADWGRPVVFLGGTGNPFSTPLRSIEVHGDRIGFSGIREAYLFDRDGQRVARFRIPFVPPGDLAGHSSGEWALALTHLPHPDLPSAREQWEALGLDIDEPPRILLVNQDFEITDQGLFAEEGISGSAAAGRTLLLAWSRQKLYAAEIANYHIYEFDRSLRLRGEFRDPELTFEEGRDSEPEAARERTARQSEVERKAKAMLATRGTDATKPPAEETVHAESYHYDFVISDIAWDPFSGHLLVLLHPGIVGQSPALDFLNPETGSVRRVFLAAPARLPKQRLLTQIAVGRKYLWLRAYDGSTPTLRLARPDLETQALKLRLPEVEIADQPAASPGG